MTTHHEAGAWRGRKLKVRSSCPWHAGGLAALMLVLRPLSSLAQVPAPEPTPGAVSDGGGAVPGVLPALAPTPSDEEPDPIASSDITVRRGQPEEPTFVQTNTAAQIVATISQQGLSNGESLFSGLGGVPNPLSARFLSAGFDRRQGFILGPVWINPTLEVGTVYRQQRGEAALGNESGLYGTITPGVALTLGSEKSGHSLSVQYDGVISIGQTEGMGTYEQEMQLNGTYDFSKLRLNIGLQGSQMSGADQDFDGNNVDRLLLALSGSANYEYSPLTSVDFTLSTPIRLYAQGDSSEGANSRLFLDYLYGPLTTIGVGAGLGTLVVEGSTQVFEQALLRVDYTPSPKLSFDTTVGYEFRQTAGAEENTPIFRLGASWQVQEGTSLGLSSERSVFNSAAQPGANYITTDVSLSATQRIGKYLQATASIGYIDDSYEQASAERVFGRDDQDFTFEVELTLHPVSKWQLILEASYGHLDSSGGVPDTAVSSKDKAFQYGISPGILETLQCSLQIVYDF